MAPSTVTKAKMKSPLITPAGQALFCSGNNPSTFDPDKIEGSVIITDAEKQQVEATIMAFANENKAALGIDMAKFQMPIAPSTDADKNPDGRWVIKAKSKIEYLPKYYDHNNVEFVPDASFRIAHGSTIRLKLGVELMKTAKFQGVVFRLLAYQILSISKQDSGFGAAEGDFAVSAPATGSANPAPQDAEDSDSAWA